MVEEKMMKKVFRGHMVRWRSAGRSASDHIG
jgi:hypothetical protein